jgi:hypothetical protein
VYVNGKPIKLRGVTRHEVNPLRGRSLTPDDWKRDAQLFRAANVNYIRTSHYPPAEEFIEWCDELGLFVEEEAPVCWVGRGANAMWSARSPYDPANLAYLQQAVLEMIQRDRSHPSVILWSLANESAWGPLWRQVNGAAALADPTRPRAFHDQAWGGYNNFGSTEMPIANFHYPEPPGPAEGFFRNHASFDDRPLKPGSPIADRIQIRLEVSRRLRPIATRERRLRSESFCRNAQPPPIRSVFFRELHPEREPLRGPSYQPSDVSCHLTGAAVFKDCIDNILSIRFHKAPMRFKVYCR